MTRGSLTVTLRLNRNSMLIALDHFRNEISTSFRKWSSTIIEVILNKTKAKLTNELVFKVEWPDRDSCRAEYEAHRDAYLEECQNVPPSLSQLGMESQQTTTLLTAQHCPRLQPIYLPKEELGRGRFGRVRKVVNVSTGCEEFECDFKGSGRHMTPQS